MLDVAWVSGDPGQAVSEVLQRGAELLIPRGSSASVAAKRLPAVTLDENRGSCHTYMVCHRCRAA